MAKNFTLQDDEDFCVFVTKDNIIYQYMKPLLWNTQHKNKFKLNAEIIARTQDIQDVWNFHLYKKVFCG